MSHFSFESEVQNILRMDAPITKGPPMRWQRKLNENSFNASRNESINCSMNASTCKTPKRDKATGSCKTPSNGQPRSSSKTPGKTPHKTPKTPSGGDRFIPSRSTTQFELGHFLITNNGKPKSEEAATLSPSQVEYRRVMNQNLNGDTLDSKIISYKDKAPQAPEGHQNNLKVLYSQSKTPGSSKKTVRHIPQVPERILDAPDLLDDYYLNLLDWSVNNHLAVSLGSHVYLWDASTGDITQLLEMESPDEYICSVAWVKEGNFLAVGCSNNEVQIWDIQQQKRLRCMQGHTARVGALSWNNFILSSGSRSGEIHHHDVRMADHQVGRLVGHTQEVCGLEWSPDGRFLASGGNDNLLNIWQAQNGQFITADRPLHTFSDHQAAVKALAWCPWQPSLLASGGGTADRHIRFWNCNTGTCLSSVDTKSQVCALLWSAEYKELISSHGYANNQLCIWKYPSMVKVAELTGHTSRVLHMAMSPDGATVVSAAADETLRLWKCFAVDPEKKKKQKSQGSRTPSTMFRQSLR